MNTRNLSVITLGSWIREYPNRLLFRHQSAYWLKTLKPITYKELRATRSEEMPPDVLDEYLATRKETEKVYRGLLPEYPKEKTFLYSTIVGMHKMESPKSFPGYTYYFTLTEDQIEKCLFEVTDEKHPLKPAKGLKALEDCIDHWIKFKKEMKSTPDSWFGSIDPRIEVIIPFEVDWKAYVPQQEDR